MSVAMNYSEQELRWAEEVIYLHSLWHQGPPNQNPNSPSPHLPHPGPTFNPGPTSSANPNPYFHQNPNPYLYSHPNPNPYIHPNHNPYYSNHNPYFHPHHNPNSYANNNPYSHPNHNPYSYPNPNPYANPSHNNLPRTHLTPEISNENQNQEPSTGNEWPCDPASPPRQSSPRTWSPFEQAAPRPTLTSGSSARDSSSSMQLAAIQTCKYFFTQESDSESKSELDSEHDVNEFFRSLFEKDAQLRGCYEKHHEDGEFYCLVCETRKGDKRKGKLYRGCTALAQHACAVSKLGRSADHKAFATAICRVLGWDPQRLPSIVLLPGSVVIAGRSEVKF